MHPTVIVDLEQVTILLVAFNSAHVLPRCLASLPPGVQVLVVDNGSTDASAEVARAGGARVLRLEENLGFGNAANRGFAEAGTRWGLLLNPDSRCAPGMVEALLEAALRYPDAGMLAPATHTEKGLAWGRPGLFDPRPRGPAPLPEGDACAPYVGGPAMFFEIARFRALGGFDPDLFLYSEDDDLCFRFRRAGLALVHVHDARLEHLSGQSTEGVSRLDWWKAWHVGWARLHVTTKHRGALHGLAWGVKEVARRWLSLATRPGDRRRLRWAAEAAGMAAALRGVRSMEVRIPRG